MMCPGGAQTPSSVVAFKVKGKGQGRMSPQSDNV